MADLTYATHNASSGIHRKQYFMRLSPTLRVLSGATLAATIFLGGCNSSDDDSASTASSTNDLTFDGTGAEALGYYVAEVTASTGIYNTVFAVGALPGNQSTRSGKLAPAGFSQSVRMHMEGGKLWFEQNMAFGNGTLQLTANTATQTYEGSYTWEGSDALDGAEITEQWTVSFAGSTVTVAIAGATDEATPQTGTVSMTLRPISDVGAALDMEFYGRNTAATDAKLVGGTAVLELYNGDPAGTYAYWSPEASTNDWVDYFYFDGVYRSGNTLKAGGWPNYSYTSDSTQDLFATITISLDGANRPSSVVGTVYDFDDIDDDGDTDVEPASFTVASSGFKNELQLEGTYASLPQFDLTVDTVTAGGALESVFGPSGEVNDSWVDFWRAGFSVDGNNFNGGYVSSSQSRVEAWLGRYYDYYNDYPDYDIDNDETTRDRLVWTINYDASSQPAVATGGTLALQQFDATGVLVNTESLTFTLNNPGVGMNNDGSYLYRGYINQPLPSGIVVPAINATTFAITNGTLQNGLTLDPSTGELTGTPTSYGWQQIEVTGTAANGKSNSAWFVVYIY